MFSSFSKLINQSDFLKKILKGTFWLTFGSVFSRGLLAIGYIILARIISTEQYGEYGMLKSTVDNFLIFAAMGIGLTTTKYIAEYKNTDKEKTSSILGTSLMVVFLTGLAISLLMVLFSNYIAVNILNSPKLETLIIFVSIILVFTAFNGVQLGALLGFQSYRKLAIANILQGVLLSIGLIIGGLVSGLKGAVVGNLISIAVVSIIVQVLLRKESIINGITISVSNWRDSLITIYKFSIPASLSTIITSPTVWVLSAMLVNQSNGYKELGIYSAVIIFSTAIQMINSSLSNVLLPIFLSKETKVTAKKEFFNYFSSWIIAIVISTPLMVFPELVTLILGKGYPKSEVSIVLGFAIISTFIIANRQGISRDLIIKNKMWLSVFSMGQWALTSYISFIYLKEYGAKGFAMSFCIGYFINMILFVPWFINMKICPKYLFYDFKLLYIWLSLILLIVFNIISTNFFIRIPVSFLLLLFIFVCLRKIFYNNVQKIN